MMSEGDGYVDLEERVLRDPSTGILHTRIPRYDSTVPMGTSTSR